MHDPWLRPMRLTTLLLGPILGLALPTNVTALKGSCSGSCEAQAIECAGSAGHRRILPQSNLQPRPSEDQVSSASAQISAWMSLLRSFSLDRMPFEAEGAPAQSDATRAIAEAKADQPLSLGPRDYRYTADTLDIGRLGPVPMVTRVRSKIAGDSLIRDRSGEVIGLAYNHRLDASYRGSYPSAKAATAITSGNLVAPPRSAATAAGPVDLAVHWYGDWGLDFYRQAIGIGGPTFHGWYDGRWNWTSGSSYDPSRKSILGYYRNDDPHVLDWQCYWLREAGVKVVIPVAFDLEVQTWGNANDRNLWVYRLFNAPNCKDLSYIPWARSANVDNALAENGAPAGLTREAAVAQWRSLFYSLARAYPNNYVLRYAGKRWFTVYVWDSEQLRLLFDSGSSSANYRVFLAARAAELVAQGYDGLAVLVHRATSESTMSRAALLASKVLYLPSPYSGPSNAKPGSPDFAGVVATYRPPASGEILNVSTALKLVPPLPPSPTFDYSGSTPVLFRTWASEAIRWIVGHRDLPRLLTISNVSEWAEQGPGLHPNSRDGWAYLDALREAEEPVAQGAAYGASPRPLRFSWVLNGVGQDIPDSWRLKADPVAAERETRCDRAFPPESARSLSKRF